MRKLSIFPLVLLFVLGLSSCKKDWTCKCEDDRGNVNWSTITNTTKSEAEELCSDREDNRPNLDCELVGE